MKATPEQQKASDFCAGNGTRPARLPTKLSSSFPAVGSEPVAFDRISTGLATAAFVDSCFEHCARMAPLHAWLVALRSVG